MIARASVRAQIAPRAHEILGVVGIVVPDGYQHSLLPNWRGVPFDVWLDLHDNHYDLYTELLTICESDFPTWCALLARIVGKGGGGTHPFIFNNSQRYLWNRFSARISAKRALKIIVLKARQIGITTFMSAWQYWQLWRQANIQTLMLGNQEKLTGRITQMFRIFHDELPDIGDIKPRLRQDTKLKTARVPKGEIYMTQRGGLMWNSWGITGSARNVDQRGFQGTHFSGSEAAFWPKLNDLKDALLPQLPPPSSPKYLECSVIFESSPQGQNEFWQLYMLGKDPRSEWESVFIPWFIQDDEYAMDIPDGWKMTADDKEVRAKLTKERKKYDSQPISVEQMYWRFYTLLNEYDGNVDGFDAEYASDDVTCFMMSDNMLFQKDMKYLHACVTAAEEDAPALLGDGGFKAEKHAIGEFSFEPLENPFKGMGWMRKQHPKFVYEKKGNVTIWEPPQDGHIYIVGADGSGGENYRDGACAHVACVNCGRQAAEFWDNSVGPEEFTDNFYHLALLYNEALVNPEVNYLGTIILKRLMTGWGYGNVAQEEKWDEIRLKPHKYGFMTGRQNKPVLVSAGVSMIKERHYKISGREMLSELSTFQFDGLNSFGDEMYSAANHKRDDRVIAYCLAMYAVRQSPKLYSAIATHQHAMPSAVELRINASPIMPASTRLPKEFLDQVPDALKNIFENQGFESQGMPANPMRGYMSGWRN